RWIERARMLLGCPDNPSFFAASTIRRCNAVSSGRWLLTHSLDDRPRPGKEPVITPKAKAWLVSLACDKAKEHGYPRELWTTRLLARHARVQGKGVQDC